MHLTNDTITVMNNRLNPASGDWELFPTVIAGVSWFDDIAAAVDPGTGLKAASKITVRIPESADFSGKQFIDSKAYQDCEPEGFFTLKTGDLLIKGIETEVGLTIQDLERKHDKICTILGVTDNRRAPNAKHWKVVGT